jgi:protein gp37
MSDLFHPEVSDEFIWRVFRTMAATPHHVYQILTKRPQRMADLLSSWRQELEHRAVEPSLPLHNVWLGTSIEDHRYSFRSDHLRRAPAALRFLSLEPLLGPLPGLDLSGIDWVIVGGESGVKARQMKRAWVRDIRRQCRLAGVPFFFKQWGGRTPKAGGRELDGRHYNEMPMPVSA